MARSKQGSGGGGGQRKETKEERRLRLERQTQAREVSAMSVCACVLRCGFVQCDVVIIRLRLTNTPLVLARALPVGIS
jgi:hypothetical protein